MPLTSRPSAASSPASAAVPALASHTRGVNDDGHVSNFVETREQAGAQASLGSPVGSEDAPTEANVFPLGVLGGSF